MVSHLNIAIIEWYYNHMHIGRLHVGHDESLVIASNHCFSVGVICRDLPQSLREFHWSLYQLSLHVLSMLHSYYTISAVVASVSEPFSPVYEANRSEHKISRYIPTEIYCTRWISDTKDFSTGCMEVLRESFAVIKMACVMHSFLLFFEIVGRFSRRFLHTHSGCRSEQGSVICICPNSNIASKESQTGELITQKETKYSQIILTV